MPPQKRNATRDPQSHPPAKKSNATEPSCSFPNFTDGDVTIFLGDLELKLHSKTLCDTCDYFVKFDELPKHFILESSDSIDVVVPVYSLPDDPHCDDTEAAISSNINTDTNVHSIATAKSTGTSYRARTASEAIFRLLYRQPLLSTSPERLFDVASLATRYGCVDAVKDALILAILKACLGTRLLLEEPWTILNAAYNLRDESLFAEALLSVVSYGGSNTRERLPGAVTDLVPSHTAQLKRKIQQCWKDALCYCSQIDGTKAGILPNALAAVLMQTYLQENVAYSSDSSLDSQLYVNLVDLLKMSSIRPMLKYDLLAAVSDVDDSLCAAQGFIDTMASWHYEEEDEWSPASQMIEKGLTIFTTRHGEVAQSLAGNDVVEIGKMTRQEAVELFEKSLLQKSPPDNDKIVIDLLYKLEYLPLAITQAAAYININKIATSDYLLVLKNTDEDAVIILSRNFDDKTRYPNSANPKVMQVCFGVKRGRFEVFEL
ncbi:hypothetical protein SLS56_008864 [Neofusicoccum ribis]|uniref:BTB domain-containing protein n=1 Tax=Neofusicoccum ribis TaxID=45134 RepID=A0ABR3SJT3_9PEZI